MYLSNLKLWNFRKYGSDEFELDNPNLNVELKQGLNVLIGENDSGKTAIIDAIKMVLKTHSYEWIHLNHEDFYKDSKRLRIELIIKDFTDEEAKNYIEWLSYDSNHKPYLKLVYDVTRNDERIFPSDVKAGIDDIGRALTAEAKEYLKCTYLKPLRDAQKELIPKQHSRISQIFMDDDAFRNHNDHILLENFKEFNRNIINYFEGLDKDGKTLSDQKGKVLKDKIDKYM